MDPVDGGALAELPALLRATEQQLRSCSQLCHQLTEESGRPALAGSLADRRGADALVEAPAPPPGERSATVHELVAQLHQLSANLARQADALAGAAGSTGVERGDLSPEQLHLRASEAERARLARELHDGPAQYFANAVFETEYLERLLARDPEAVAGGLGRLREDLRRGVAEIRRCLFDSRLPAVEELGLVALLRGYLPDYERQYGLAVDAALPAEELPISPDQAIAIFRILQEALTNARKHAGAQQIRVALRRGGSELNLLVEDNGRGFVGKRPRPGQYGLLGMQERAQLVGGRLEGDGRPGKGVRIMLRVPLR